MFLLRKLQRDVHIITTSQAQLHPNELYIANFPLFFLETFIQQREHTVYFYFHSNNTKADTGVMPKGRNS